ncbi:hypothetical protein RND71_025794 [Anisodus tanguticus]|uniref:Methylenetetrahydrofolate reductase n=1 Tax=Anisodus tanguticus TaxID=243964 RepID=A0AAE1RJQ7_9SOLA|nr:hypothetical protein RND71_025794 [Anisodus tanguticus]
MDDSYVVSQENGSSVWRNDQQFEYKKDVTSCNGLERTSSASVLSDVSDPIFDGEDEDLATQDGDFLGDGVNECELEPKRRFIFLPTVLFLSFDLLFGKAHRAKYGDYFGITVDAGADLIVTQLFYDTDNFLKFVNDCRQIRITCPIVPGIMPINNYKSFLRMTGFCKTKIPAEITAALEPIKDNEEAVKAYGIHLGTEMCKKIMASGIKTLHLYTLNMEKSALAILMNLGLIEESKISRPLPWRRPTNVFCVKEDVRPIFWANRPKSYISRTIGWDEYPHGRWGNAQNPSYGALSDYQLMRARSRDKKLQELLLSIVWKTSTRFMNYCLGKLKSCPWSELDGLQAETKIIDEHLSNINTKGFLTINSQSAVNGAKSDAPLVDGLQAETKIIDEHLSNINTKGFLTINSQSAVNGAKSDAPLDGGGPGGYVYQKAYLELFCSREKLNAVVAKCKAFPFLTYMAVNKEGNWISNANQTDINAVTWGVFPATEIVQPTVVDPASFMVWKDEAFEIWSRGWAQLYSENDPSRKLLEQVQNSYFLVDNDYINGDLFAIFKDISN